MLRISAFCSCITGLKSRKKTSFRENGIIFCQNRREFHPIFPSSTSKRQGKKAIKEDGAECILLGCAGFVDFVEALNRELGVPVLDGVSPAVKLAEAYVKLGIKTSKVNTYKYPEKKDVIGFKRIKEGLYL